jgi:uncharacterized protein (DUF1501 family)
MNRRQFLASAAGSAAAIGWVPAVPQVLLRACENARGKHDGNVLVVLQLSGGNDGLNTVVPFGDDAYYRNRYSLGIGKNAVRKIDDHLGFHTEMSGFAELLEAGRLNVVQGVGYPNPNRSHFESMDLWHTAHRQREQVPEGWLGSYFEASRSADRVDVPGIHFGAENQPLALASHRMQVPSIRSLESFRFEFAQNAELKRSVNTIVEAAPADENDLLSFLQASCKSALRTSHRVEEILGEYKSAVRYPDFPIGQKLQTVAQLIGAGMQTSVYYVALDGFDTHANQPAAHGGLLNQLSSSVAAFVQDLEAQGNLNRVTLFSFSEFGRRVKQNASDGTDHGAAAPVFLVGGQVKGGLTGDHPSLTDLDDGDLKHNIDYRQVYATLLDKWLAVDSKKILGEEFVNLELFTR